MEKPMIKEYTNGEITVLWKPEQCIHSGICLRGLPKVFDLKQKPWVNMDAASSEDIVNLVKECPSKALLIKGVKFKENDNSEVELKLINGGPLIIKTMQPFSIEKIQNFLKRLYISVVLGDLTVFHIMTVHMLNPNTNNYGYYY